MRDDFPASPESADDGGGFDDALALQALLYASGELEEAEAVAFEERLAEDQIARDALCQAVQLTETLAGNPEVRPDPSYRARVRRRLWLRRRLRMTLPGTLRLAGNPFFWAMLGLTVAVLMIVLVAHMITAMNAPRLPPNSTVPDLRPATNREEGSLAPFPAREPTPLESGGRAK